MEGGTALARLLAGAVSPSGKLPFTIARDPGDYPPFDKDADAIVYGPLHGYTLMERSGKTPLFPFGFGLSYTCFAYEGPEAQHIGDHISCSIAVRNTGRTAGREVAQLYAGFPETVSRPHKLLCGFASVELQPGEARRVEFNVLLNDLAWWNEAEHRWTVERGRYVFYFGGDSATAELTVAQIEI
jgi:beta-glucosidase